jgi:hypothetical protein
MDAEFHNEYAMNCPIKLPREAQIIGYLAPTTLLTLLCGAACISELNQSIHVKKLINSAP